MIGSFAVLLAAFAVAAPSPQPRVLVAGPALAGNRVVWGEQRDRLSVLRAWPNAAPLWESASSWFAGPLAGSPFLIAFSRSYNGCPGQPGVACPVETQTLAARPRASPRPLAAAERCSAGGPNRRLAVSGSLVALLELGCGSSTPSVTVHKGTRTVFRRQGAACCDVALAGRYLAWRSGDSVDVLDLHTHRVLYRVDPPPREPIAAFDIQADGTLAFVLGPAPNGRATLAWRAAASPSLHRLALDARFPPQGPAVRIVGDHIVFEVAVGPRSSSQLDVSDLRGHLHVLARFSKSVEQAGAIDATFDQVTWASRRIASSHMDCPPPGQGRACGLLKSGTETIWLADLKSGTPRPIARWAFTDAP
jgi:hypothetical protein